MTGAGCTQQFVYMSLSEISALSCRAARGAGFEWGAADEAASAAVWLSRAGIDWLDLLLRVLRDSASSAPHVAVGCWRGDTRLCPLRTGIALSDFAALPEGLAKGSLKLASVARPLFLIPFAARAAETLSVPLRISTGKFDICLAPGAPPVFAVTQPDEDGGAESPCDILIGFCEAPATLPVWPGRHSGCISADLYGGLAGLAMQTTVPTSARSLAGAGALGDDND